MSCKRGFIFFSSLQMSLMETGKLPKSNCCPGIGKDFLGKLQAPSCKPCSSKDHGDIGERLKKGLQVAFLAHDSPYRLSPQTDIIPEHSASNELPQELCQHHGADTLLTRQEGTRFLTIKSWVFQETQESQVHPSIRQTCRQKHRACCLSTWKGPRPGWRKL